MLTFHISDILTVPFGAVMRLRYGYSAYFGTCKVVTSRCERTLIF